MPDHRDAVRRMTLPALLLVASFPPMAAAAAPPASDAPASSAPASPANVKVTDRENDNGDCLVIEWELSPDDRKGAKPPRVLRYEVLRMPGPEPKEKPDAPGKPGEFGIVMIGFFKVGEQTARKSSFTDTSVEAGTKYRYRVVAVGPDQAVSRPAESEAPVEPTRQWINQSRLWFGAILLVVCGSVTYFIEVARRGRDLKIRRIAGLEAVDEAVGRATEMGRPLLFVPGIMDINDIQTVAGITILSRVAKTAAEYDARLEVPTSRSLVMTAARETVEAAYLGAGRPDAYREDDIYYLTDEQFGYVAGVTGSMVREKPAACFYMGSFFAESLILAETGNTIGAIQVAGTAQPSQLPFFVAACDYTLIGEEFFAASAYLSGEPHQLGSLKGQDLGKVIGAGLLLVGCLLATFTELHNASVPKGEPEKKIDSAAYLRDNVLGEAGWRPK